ncbi:bifunctional folylpolyglutamate synthase/dihydrofolate synthase [Erythrobacter sp. GH1-10]|uniref:bifunctional folylpolyglutamate synthase/dihydrofolate synthase n=1 Tax=Erythrobacter sp. GH1-10 TaxID=3349334 RepID=UPI003877E0D5
MRDMGRSDDPRVQAQLDRLAGLSIQRDTLGLDAVRELLSRLGDPHSRLPPTFHVAGTNGKGSTCAFLRAMLEAEGYEVHVTTSPHLVRYNERFRVAGKLIEDARLADLLEEVFDAAEGLGCSFFEISIAAAFTEFARVPADACVVEVGLGGRLDATNVLEPEVLAACGIAALGIDHERFLLAPEEGVPIEPMARIAFEKAGIAKKGVPLVTLGAEYPPEAVAAIRDVAADVGAPLFEWLRDFEIPISQSLPIPPQAINAGLASAMLRLQDKISISERAIEQGKRDWVWPARMQSLGPGPLTLLVDGQLVILDGAHNPSAGLALANSIGGPVHLILGMLDNKDPRSLLNPLGDKVRSLTIVPVPNHDSHPPEAFGPDARAADSIEDALLTIPSDDFPILIAGSLYLAGEVLRLNDEIPD